MTNPLSLDYQVIFEKISNSVSELSILEPLIILIWCIGYTGSCLIEADLSKVALKQLSGACVDLETTIPMEAEH
ncbi:hypothetical protein EB796_023525 [Bugula neritina]|uniref:Uncharacterized protein n=1 Tax=Bugula neritina TaxID=10212 RepID=A0A7J7IWE8_BUGNE|nr:hypothetical protein EB796_023525 [Bugula neritina]